MEFIPNPLCNYEFDYVDLSQKVDSGELPLKGTYRALVLEDLFFIVYFIMGIKTANNPFVVDMCYEVGHGPRDYTLDVWAREHFKDLYVDTPVLTTEGWKAHGDLVPGDFVYSPSGKSTKVIATEHFEQSGCYQITFDNHICIKAGKGHLWDVEVPSRKRVPGTFKNGESHGKRNTRESKTLTTEELYDLVGKTKFRVGIKTTKPLDGLDKDLPVDPYVLGSWLGDGFSASATLCGIDKGIFEEVEKRGYSLVYRKESGSRHPDWKVARVVDLIKGLRQLGLIQNKHIPEIYLTASRKQRLDLLRGLIDTDGNVAATKNATVTFTQKNYRLAKQVQTLCNSLGYKARITPIRSVDSWQVCFQAYFEVDNNPCLLGRKVELLKTLAKRQKPSTTWYINKIEPYGVLPTNCISVEAEDGMYLVGEELIPTHNSSIITVAETIQYCLKYPEEATGIFSYIRPIAKKFLFEIKSTFENSSDLKSWFPDVLWANPQTEAPLWSLDEGIVLKRKSNRKEATISAWGLTEGMPTGLHFPRRIYDDISTEDLKDSPDMMEKVKEKFDSSQNLGTDGGSHRVIGTFYSHNDPLVYIRDKRNEDGSPTYLFRKYPATRDGKVSGDLVMLSRERFEKLKQTKTFRFQQLLDPTPQGMRKLESSLLQEIDPKKIPRNLYKFMPIDPAGDDKDGKGDSWAVGVIGVEPSLDEIGANNVYICDLLLTPMREEEAPEEIARMYRRNGLIMQVGVEKVGLSTTEIHVANALAKIGVHLSQDRGNLVLLRPGGMDNRKRIERAIPWPLYNGKIFISTAIPEAFREKLKQEMDQFPYWHDDGLTILSYFYDMIKNFRFGWYIEEDEEEHSDYIGRSAASGY